MTRVPKVFKKMTNIEQKRIFSIKDKRKIDIYHLDPSIDIKEIQNQIKEIKRVSGLTLSQYISEYKCISEYITDINCRGYANYPAFSHLKKGNPDFDKFIQRLVKKYADHTPKDDTSEFYNFLLNM